MKEAISYYHPPRTLLLQILSKEAPVWRCGQKYFRFHSLMLYDAAVIYTSPMKPPVGGPGG